MQNTFILLPIGNAAPAAKSLPDAAFGNLSNAPVFAASKSGIQVVAGYRFVAHLEAGVAVPRSEFLNRHNKANFVIEAGKATWDAGKDILNCLAVGRQGHTAETQLVGAFFKVATPSKLQLGVTSPQQNSSTLTPLPLAISFFTGQDDNGSVIVLSNNTTDIVEGWEITKDSFVWKSGGEVVQSYPRTFNATISGGTFGDGSTALNNTDYTEEIGIISDTPQIVSTVDISLTDNVTGQTALQSVTLIPALTKVDRTVTSTVGENFALDIASLVNLERQYLADFLIVEGNTPQGLVLNNGVLTGQFGADRVSVLRVLVTDVAGQTADVTITFNISARTNVSIQLPSASKGASYKYIPRFPVGFENITLNEPLPEGLNLNPATGEFSGIVANSVLEGQKTVRVTVVVKGSAEQIEIPLEIFSRLQVSYSLGDNVYTVLIAGVPVAIRKDALISLAVQGGSSRYSITANNGAVVNQSNQVHFLNSGETVVTIVDRNTRLQASFTFVVTAQDAIFAYAVNSTATKVQKNRPLVCEVGKNLVVGFSRWTILDYDSNRLLKLQPINAQNFDQIGEGSAFALFTSKTNDAKLQMPRGLNFVTAFGVNPELISMTGDVIIGLGRLSEENLKYSVALTTVNGVRQAEIRVDGVVVVDSRVDIIAGQVLKVAAINDTFGLYLDGGLRSSVSGENLAFWDFIIEVKQAGVKLGGQITGLEYSILTEGSPSAIGTIHPQTGLYVPTDENVSNVTIEGKVLGSSDASYQTDIVIIRGSVLESFTRAKLQNKTLYVWIADQERGDNKPLRFTEDGKPDANQIKNAVHVGKLQASGKWDATEKRTDFSNDTGVYDTGYTLTKYTITGNVLNVMNPRIVKTLVPFIEVHNSEIGSLAFSQKASGCIPSKRVVLVWESTLCSEDKAVWDAIEFPNAKSFTAFNWEIGSDVATMLPMSIEAYPDEMTNHLWHLFRFDSQFVQI